MISRAASSGRCGSTSPSPHRAERLVPVRRAAQTRVTMPARSSLPSSAHCASRGKSSGGRWSPPCETRMRARLPKSRAGRASAVSPAGERPISTTVPPVASSESPSSNVARRPTTSKAKSTGPRSTSRRAELQRLLEPSARRGRARGSRTPRRCALPARPTARPRRSRSPRLARPRQTCAVSSTDITPVATAQPIRHACSTGSSRRHLHRGGLAGRPCASRTCRSQHGRERRRRRARKQPARRGGRPPACRAGSPRGTAQHVPQAAFQPSTTRSPARERRDALADGLDRAGALVPEQHRERVAPAVLFDHVQVAVADAGRLDPDEHLARPGRVDDDLLERDRAGLGEDYAASSAMSGRARGSSARPASARLRSISAIRFWSSSSTPRCPPTASA